jgi:hypothetical protein
MSRRDGLETPSDGEPVRKPDVHELVVALAFHRKRGFVGSFALSLCLHACLSRCRFVS